MASYTVQSGDSLSKIAAGFEGVSTQEIFQANTDKIDDPDLIFPGQVLTIPDEETTTAEIPKVPGTGLPVVPGPIPDPGDDIADDDIADQISDIFSGDPEFGIDVDGGETVTEPDEGKTVGGDVRSGRIFGGSPSDVTEEQSELPGDDPAPTPRELFDVSTGDDDGFDFDLPWWLAPLAVVTLILALVR